MSFENSARSSSSSALFSCSSFSPFSTCFCAVRLFLLLRLFRSFQRTVGECQKLSEVGRLPSPNGIAAGWRLPANGETFLTANSAASAHKDILWEGTVCVQLTERHILQTPRPPFDRIQEKREFHITPPHARSEPSVARSYRKWV